MAKAAAKGMLHVLAAVTVIIIVGGLAFMAYRQREGNSASSNCKTECLKTWSGNSDNCDRCCVDNARGALRITFDQKAHDCMQTNSDYKKDKHPERLARLAGGVAVVKVGVLGET